MARNSTPAEQASAILFLASDEAAYITGLVLPVGGGIRGNTQSVKRGFSDHSDDGLRTNQKYKLDDGARLLWF
ncbi:SDR family oxidoreductase [Amphritea sp.]|uniref:SDR family oxidoreductase n=1 Tax=Amphritea sp. TaxID=1872502 RepID=UPI003A92EA91